MKITPREAFTFMLTTSREEHNLFMKWQGK
jgi:hypothetical protein